MTKAMKCCVLYDLSRPLIGALNLDSTDKKMAFVQLLVENGCDVNRIYDLYGDCKQGIHGIGLD